jgi:hypothetical protein
MNYNEFLDHVDLLADQTVRDLDNHGGYICDSVITQIDGSEYVIYYAKAWDLVNEIRFRDQDLYLQASEMLEDCKEGRENLDELMSLTAHWILYTMVGDKAEEILNAKEEC